MNPFYLFCFLAFFSALSPLWADPAVVENFDFKVNLSETLPGVDNLPATLGGPVINVDVTDKLRSVTTRFPLKVYSINEYFLSEDKLNLLCRVTLRDTIQQRYSFIQLNLSNAPESRQYSGIKRYFFSPDNGALLAVFDDGGPVDSIGIIRVDKGPAGLGWLYSGREKINLFQNVLPDSSRKVRLASVAGWSADALAAAFVLSAEEGTAEAPVLKYYLACLYLNGDHFTAVAQAVDLSAYQLPRDGTIDKVECLGDQATLYFAPKDLSGTSKVVFKLPKPASPANEDRR